MRKIKFKNFIIYMVFFSIILSWAQPSLASNGVKLPTVIYETMETENLGPGIQHENIKKFTFQGWWNINVIRVDLNDQYAEIKGLMSDKGFTDRQTVSKLVDSHEALAGINGDFFSIAQSSPMGAFIEEGEVKAAPINSINYPTFYLDSDKKADIAIFTRQMHLKALDKGKEIVIYQLNRPVYDLVYPTVFDKYYGSHSMGNKTYKDLVEMVVINDRVQEIRVGQAPIAMPENGYIVAARAEGSSHILDNFQVGDRVKFNISANPNLENIKFAIGAGNIILKNGIPTDSNPSLNVNGNHPRTGIGISQDGKELILATIDGRHAFTQGARLETFGALLKSLGAYNAVNLDGGGSTTMAIKPKEEKVEVVNRPSDGSERRVPNGVGVFSNAPQGELDFIKVTADEKNMFVDTSRKFTVKAYDEYYNPVAINQEDVSYRVEGIEGDFQGNLLKAKSQGQAKVIANYRGVEASTDIRVLGPAQSIELANNQFNLPVNSSRKLGDYYGRDSLGFKARIYPEDLNFTVNKDLGYVEENTFYSKDQTGAGAISVSLGEAVNNILFSIGNEVKLIKNLDKLEDLQASVYPDSVKGSLALSDNSVISDKSLQIKYDFSAGNGTRAVYANFKSGDKKGLALEGKPVGLGLWVKGDGQGSWLRGHIKDKNGKEHYIDFAKNVDFHDWQYVEASMPNNLAYPISLERIYLVEANGGKHAGEVLINGLTGLYPIAYDRDNLPEASELVDEKNTKDEKAQDGFSFIISKTPRNMAGQNFSIQSVMEDKVNQHDVALFMGGGDTEFIKKLQPSLKMNTGINYLRRVHENVMFIDANNKDGGLRATNPDQWLWLKDNLENTQEDHIVLLLPKPVFDGNGFKDAAEAELLHKLLAETADKGKTVWVVHGGSDYKTDIRDGVRYMEFDNRSAEDFQDIANIRAIEFVVNGGDISYQINHLYR